MANITRWSPFDEALSLRDAMSRLFEDSFVAPAAMMQRGNVLGVEMNVYETPQGFKVEASVPGIKPEDLDISIQDNVLTISGELHESKTEEGTTTHRSERRYGRFSRSIALPTLVKSDAINASLEHGILHLDIPKAEEVKPRKISVHVGNKEPEKTLEANS